MKNQRRWLYARNPFETATDGSFRAMKKIGEYTLNALSAYRPGSPGPSLVMGADASIFNNLENMLQPLADDYNTKYNSWKGQKSGQKSTTTALTEQLLLLRSDKIREWDIAIQSVYSIKSQGYLNLLPNRRSPFQNGSQDDRIAAVGALNERADKDGSLPTALKADIAAFFSALNANQKTNQKGKTTTKGKSSDLEDARLAYCEGLFEVLGTLMAYFKNKPEKVEIFFDLESIRNKEQTVFNRILEAGQTVKVMEHTFTIEDSIRINNNGDTTVKFYLAANESDAPGTLSVTVPANTEEQFTAAEFGIVATNHLLMAHNENELAEGSFTLTLL